MDRKQAQELWPVMQAYADGKEIQYFVKNCGWYSIPEKQKPSFSEKLQWRIKPEPKTVPLTIEDLYEHFKKGTIFTNSTTHNCRIQSISIKKKQLIMPTSFSDISIVDFLPFWTFEDGSPLTKIVEE